MTNQASTASPGGYRQVGVRVRVGKSSIPLGPKQTGLKSRHVVFTQGRNEMCEMCGGFPVDCCKAEENGDLQIDSDWAALGVQKATF